MLNTKKDRSPHQFRQLGRGLKDTLCPVFGTSKPSEIELGADIWIDKLLGACLSLLWWILEKEIYITILHQ